MVKKIVRQNFFNGLFIIYKVCLAINLSREQNIETSSTTNWHFAKCNNSKCTGIFLVNPEESPGDLGFICPICSAKTITSHIVQCSSCKTILNFVRATPSEEKVVFNVPKCSHCIGTIEDEWEIEPLYQPDSYI